MTRKPSEIGARAPCSSGDKSTAKGRIQRHDRFDDLVTGTVSGSKLYNATIDFAGRSLDTNCTCPYDGSGDCKHVVAVLLTVDDRDTETGSDPERDETVNIESLIEQTVPEDLRTLLRDIVAEDRDIRNRFVAFVGEDTGKTVYDYKQEINRLFDDAVNRREMVEHDTHIDFSQYTDLAASRTRPRRDGNGYPSSGFRGDTRKLGPG